jgi:Flp pilus assembly protein TadD
MTGTKPSEPAEAASGERSAVWSTIAVVAIVAVAAIAVAAILWSRHQPAGSRDGDLLRQGREAVAADPDSPDGHMTLGAAYIEAGDFEAAAREFETAANLMEEAGSPTALADYNLAQVHRLSGRHEDAVAVLTVIVRGEGRGGPEAPEEILRDASYWLGVELLEVERPGEALSTLEPLLEDAPDDADVAMAMARAHEMLSHTEFAADLYERVLEIRPGDPDATAGLERTGP